MRERREVPQLRCHGGGDDEVKALLVRKIREHGLGGKLEG